MTASEDLTTMMPRYLVRWNVDLLNGNVTHGDLAKSQGITSEMSRTCQKRSAQILGLPWGRQKIPHIIVHLVKERLINLLIIVSIATSAMTGTSTEFRRVNTGHRNVQRVARANRRQRDIPIIPIAA